jgi:hypothetical protein
LEELYLPDLEDINEWRKIFVIVVMKFKQGRNSGLQDFKRLQTASRDITSASDHIRPDNRHRR